MVTVTSAATKAIPATGETARGRVVKTVCKRNMDVIRLCAYENEPSSIRTKNHPSPAKQSASNHHPGQPHTRAPVDATIQRELADARFIADDLADHMFGHLVPTDMARDILKKFVAEGTVEVCEGKPSVGASATVLDKKSEAVQRALDAAFKAAKVYGCIRSHSDAGLAKTPPAQADTGEKAGKASKVQPHFWRWKDFPKAPLGEDALVNFLNKITDSARRIAEPQLGDAKSTVRNRFAAPEDKHHAVPLAYEADGEDMRPDFLVLPIEAFSSDMKTVDEKYSGNRRTRSSG
ncbi:hypothetical protein BU15DRAFT_61606 [Melanogaster broomeanus]|nr:hypothetical protein BU15DRAFT_61606 [Melanogaster broomeanus]